MNHNNNKNENASQKSDQYASSSASLHTTTRATTTTTTTTTNRLKIGEAKSVMKRKMEHPYDCCHNIRPRCNSTVVDKMVEAESATDKSCSRIRTIPKKEVINTPSIDSADQTKSTLITTFPPLRRALNRATMMERRRRERRDGQFYNVVTITLCHLLFSLLLPVVISLFLLKASVSASSDPLSPESISMPAYAPTRTPHQQQLAVGQHQAKPVEAMATSAQTATGKSKRNQLQIEPKTASSNTKFTRTNELDVFLDDMNHNELRTVAAGKPISDLFQPKPVVVAATSLGHRPSQVTETGGNKKQVDNGEGESGGGEGEGGGRRKANGGLEASHSEQQIYSECALILQRTYVKNIDDPKHQLVPFGKTEQACISYKHIDKAVEQAKHKLKFRELAKKRKKLSQSSRMAPPPFEIIHSTLEPPEDLVAAIGEINMATTQIIADQFDLSNDELLNGLPLIDMSKTKFWSICPLLVRQDIKCEITRFRTHTGHCNNLKHPTWGAAMTPFARYLPPVHPDGIWIPRKSIVSEITFELSEGHRETHSNIAPTMPLPVFQDHNHIQHHQHHHHHVHHRQAAAATVSTANAANTEMVAGSSVQFIRHAQLDEQAPGVGGGSNTQSSLTVDEHSAMSGASGASQSQPSPGSVNNHLMFSTPLVNTAASQTHYQQSHSPSSPYLAHTAPLMTQGSHSQHYRQQPQQLTAEATTSHGNHKIARSVPHDLPAARLVTSVVHRDVDLPNHDFSILFMSWGQLLDHDMTRAAQPPSTIKCCGQEEPKHKLCLPIHVPANDPFYSKFNVHCLEFRRTLAGVRPNCVLGPRVHQNAITSPIDANFVYGSSRAHADALRLFKGGRLRDRDWFKREGLKPLLPAQDIEPDLECIARPKDLFCFLAGDVRANEQTHLTVLHTLYMREHNAMADKLASLNPHWNDERIYQETRHIMAASVQHVMINEYIPLLIGKKMTELYNLTAQVSPAHHSEVGAEALHLHPQHHLHLHRGASPKHSYWHGYDPSVTTSVSNSFAAAAFRQGHTFVQGSVERWNKFHEFVASEKLRHLFKQPFLLYQPGVLDELTSGMINQPSQSYDPFLSEDISGHLFQPPELQFGHDLAAINLQRGREQGLPGYNLWREWCGLPRAETFDQLEPYLTNHTAYHYSRLYKHVDDIDLWSGGVSERKLPGAAIGPTFACIIARQFSNTRRGDRFWYENPGLPSSFTPEQLAEIRKVSLAKLLCANSDDLPTIQRWALRMPHPVLNPRIPCHQLPEMNLHFWQEE